MNSLIFFFVQCPSGCDLNPATRELPFKMTNYLLREEGKGGEGRGREIREGNERGGTYKEGETSG